METEIKDGCERPVKLLQIPNWNLPPDFQNNCRHFVCFIVSDASEISDEQICSFAEQLLQKGMVHMTAWGPDCERVHDITDSIIIERELESGVEDTIMTVWEADESLDDALWGALYVAFPSESFETTCSNSTIIVINNDGWASHIKQRLSNLEQLHEDVT